MNRGAQRYSEFLFWVRFNERLMSALRFICYTEIHGEAQSFYFGLGLMRDDECATLVCYTEIHEGAQRCTEFLLCRRDWRGAALVLIIKWK